MTFAKEHPFEVFASGKSEVRFSNPRCAAATARYFELELTRLRKPAKVEIRNADKVYQPHQFDELVYGWEQEGQRSDDGLPKVFALRGRK